MKEKSLTEIWHGPEMESFRREHLAGLQSQCSRSQKDHACHLHHGHLEQYAKFDTSLQYPPIRLDFMVDSFCNLKCVMCTNVLEDNGGYDHDEFWDHCAQHIFPHVKELEIIGGEPFILDNTFRLIDLVTKHNPDCLWRVTTNAHYQFNERFKKAADKMKFESLAVSVDSLKQDTFSQIRAGARLDLVLKTLDDWVDYSQSRPADKPLKIVVNFVIQKDNAYELPSFIDFCLKKSVVPYPILLRDPDDYSIFDWPSDRLLDLFDYLLEHHKAEPHPSLALICHKIFKELPKATQVIRVEKLTRLLAKESQAQST